MTTRLARLLYRFRIPLSVLILLGAVALSPRLVLRSVDNDISAWFSHDDAVYRDYDRFREEFGGTQPLIVAFQLESASGADMFTRERLEFLQRVSDEIERVPSVQHVRSLATTSMLRAVPGRSPDDTAEDLELEPLLGDLDRRSIDDIRTLALSDPVICPELVSRDGRVTALVVTFDEPRLQEARADILGLIHRIAGSGPPAGVSAHFNGSIEIAEHYNRITFDNRRHFLPPVIALTCLGLYVMLRSWRLTLVTMIVVLTSVVWALGLYSLMGFGFNILVTMLGPLVIVLAISDDVHIVQHYEQERGKGPEHAFVATVSYLLTPLAGASATTALGLLSLATSDVVAVRHFGIGAAAGVMADFLMSLVLLPTLLGWVGGGRRATAGQQYLTAPLRRAAVFACRRPGAVLLVWAALVVAAVFGITRLQIETNHLRFFAATHPLTRSAAVIDRDLAGVYTFHLLLEGPPDSLKTPDAVTRIDRLAAGLSTLPDVRKVTSMADYVKRTNRELHGGGPAASAVPGEPDLLAQELFLFAMSDEGRRELERAVSSDFSKAQITVRLPSMDSDRILDRIQRSEQLARGIFAGTAITPTVTGHGRLYTTLDHYLVVSQISSVATAFLTVFGAVFLLFRSVKFGLLAIPPTLCPVVIVLGTMGWLGISLNVATVMVASVALGIVDDDTIHFINRFRHEMASGRSSVEAAIDTATASEGTAALMTAIINGCGFCVLMLSEYKPSRWFGALLAITMGVAFIAEIFLLPALLKATQARAGRHWAPRIWLGCSAGAWFGLLRRNRFAVGPQHLHTAVVDSFASGVNSVLGVVETIVHGRAIARASIDRPLFIIGHWRSGTTLLHELLCLDRRHAGPTVYECCAPHHFLVTESRFPKLFWFLMPDTRPVDQMEMDWASTFEDEFAMCLLGARSPYETIAFPNSHTLEPALLDPGRLAPPDARRWRALFLRFLRKVSLRHAGRRLVLKSPPHTCRIRPLLELFPEAQFVHIVRNPYDVVPSTKHLWRTLHRTQGLQNPNGEMGDETVLSVLAYVHGCVERDRAAIPPGQFHELRYEDLVREPVDQMRRLYEQLQLGAFSETAPAIDAYFASRKTYSTNRYQTSDVERRRIGERCADVIRCYGYLTQLPTSNSQLPNRVDRTTG